MAILVTGAHEQDRDGGRLLLQALRMCFPGIRLIWADQGYSGTLVTWAATSLNITLQIVRKLADQTGFVVLHRRWAVEHTFSWINRCDAPSATTNAGRNTTPRWSNGPWSLLTALSRGTPHGGS